MIQLDLFNADGTPCVYNPCDNLEVEAGVYMDLMMYTPDGMNLSKFRADDILDYLEESYAFYLDNATEYPIMDFCEWYNEEVIIKDDDVAIYIKFRA